jgi:hypothetical protein
MEDRVITQIGSLPFEDVGQAIKYSLAHDIPFLPELPKLGDNMTEYIKKPGSLSCLSKFKQHQFDVVKVQSIGPATMIMIGYSEDEAIERIYNHVSEIIKDLTAEEIILFLDEPALGRAGFNYHDAWEATFSSFDVIRGVHCCGNMDWDILFKSSLIDIVSFDASQFDITAYPFYRNRKKIAWGVEEEDKIRDFQKGDLITLPCGMSPLKYLPIRCPSELIKLQ